MPLKELQRSRQANKPLQHAVNEPIAEPATSTSEVITNAPEAVSEITPSHTFEPIDEEFADVPDEEINEAQSEEIGEELVDDENFEENLDNVEFSESTNNETLHVSYDDSFDEDIPVIRSSSTDNHGVSAEANFQGLNEQEVQQMSDEEFAAFMQKAQAFYDNASSAPSASSSVQPSANFAQPATSSAATPQQTSSTQFTTNSTPTVSKYDSSSTYSAPVQKEPEEDKYSSYSFGNEMTDEEYIAYLNRSARASRKDDPKPAAVPTPPEKPTSPAAESKPAKKSERKSFMPEEGEGGMTDEEFEAYLAEHGDDDDDDEGPVVYGAGKD